MTDLDQILMVALERCAAEAPGVAGFTDVRRRVRRRRQRHSALVALPTLVGVGAMATWTTGGDDERVVGVEPTTTETSISPSISPGSTKGFRCSDAGMLAGDIDAWLYFQGCESWDVAVVATSTTLPSVESTNTTWTGPSTDVVGFLNASSVDGIAGSITYSRFGAGDPQSSAIKSDISFVMYSDPMDEPTASAVATELGIPLRSSIDAAYLIGQTQITIFVVIGEDLASQFAAVTVTSAPPIDRPVTGEPMRCWDPSEVDGEDLGYRYFTTCESTQSGDVSGGAAPWSTEPQATTAPTALGCTAGHATVADGETPAIVATRYNISVAELNSANADTPGYSSWMVGLVVIVPCPAVG